MYFIFAFLLPSICRYNNHQKLYFELGNSYTPIIKRNNSDTFKNKITNQDAALIPLKDLPKHKPLW